MCRDGTRLFSGIPESRKSPGILEKGKKFWNLEKLKESYNSNLIYNHGNWFVEATLPYKYTEKNACCKGMLGFGKSNTHVWEKSKY